jgi:hypothetical protein
MMTTGDEVQATDAPANRTIVVAMLRSLRSNLDVDLCAYLHQPLGEGASLAIAARPGVEPLQCFGLFDAMKALLEGDSGERTMKIYGYHAIMFSSNGPRSRGVHLVASIGPFPVGLSIELARQQCRLLSSVVHDLQDYG